jgi:hypothetical protein
MRIEELTFQIPSLHFLKLWIFWRQFLLSKFARWRRRKEEEVCRTRDTQLFFFDWRNIGFLKQKIIRKRIFRKWICLFWERARKSIFQRLCHFVLWQVFTFIILSRRAFKLLWRYTYELRLDNSCSIWQISTNVKILQVDCQIVNCHF